MLWVNKHVSHGYLHCTLYYALQLCITFEKRIKGRSRYSFWNHCQINSLCPALVCSFKHKDLFGTRVSSRSNREQTCPLPRIRWHFGRQCDPALRKQINQCVKKKTTYDIRNFLDASSIDRRVTHQPGPLLTEQRAPVSCYCCCWSWWWWTSCGLTAWRCKYSAGRTIKTETNKVVKFILSTWRFKGSLKNTDIIGW